MTPVEIRESLNELIDAYKRAWHRTHTRKTLAKHILAVTKKYPWVMDQIPWDVFDIAVADASR